MNNMDAYENLCTRRSVRKFNDKKVEDSILEKIVYAGQCAPTGMNRQPIKMVVVRNKDLIQKLSKMNAKIMGVDMDPFYGCDCLIIVFASPMVSPTYLYDGTLVMGNLMNAAHALNVSSCWIHRAKEMFETDEGKQLKKEWNIDEEYVGIGNCILGYSDEMTEIKERTSEVIWK